MTINIEWKQKYPQTKSKRNKKETERSYNNDDNKTDKKWNGMHSMKVIGRFSICLFLASLIHL